MPKPDMGVMPTEWEVRAFSACSDLLSGVYRMGEYRLVQEELDFYTEDFVLEIVHLEHPDALIRKTGKAEMAAWMQSAASSFPVSPTYWRTHLLSNMIWRSLSETEVKCAHWMVTYDNADAGPEPSISAVIDCIQRFRLEEGFWRLSYRFYLWDYRRSAPNRSPTGAGDVPRAMRGT